MSAIKARVHKRVRTKLEDAGFTFLASLLGRLSNGA